VIFGGLVVLLDLALRRTVWGRRMYAVGGQRRGVAASRHQRHQVRILAFVGASTLAAVGGVLAASRVAAVNQTSGGSDILLNAIATAVIGDTSLFGGRGRAYAALLGRLGRQVGQRVIARKPGEPDDPIGEEVHVVDRRDPRWLNAQ
jgi:D-xylose transport system permease protein